MHFLDYYYKKIIRYDLLNKFPKNNSLQNIPIFQKIVLNFACTNSEIKKLSSTSILLELLTSNKVKITKSKKPNIFLKIRKGSPTGCKVILKDKLMYIFIYKLLSDILPKAKNFKKITVKKKKMKTSISFFIDEILLVLSELEEHFNLLDGSSIPTLNITMVTNSKSQEEFMFLLESMKLPIYLK